MGVEGDKNILFLHAGVALPGYGFTCTQRTSLNPFFPCKCREALVDTYFPRTLIRKPWLWAVNSGAYMHWRMAGPVEKLPSCDT